MSVDLINNPNQRTPCLLVLDASYSMGSVGPSGKKAIDELNEGIRIFIQSLQDDPTALTRVQVAVVSVGGPRNNADLLLDWTDANELQPFSLTANGTTPLAEGILLALNSIEDLKNKLKQNGISYTRPWIFIISDGEPTSLSDVWADAVRACENARSRNQALIYSIAVDGANVGPLEQLSGATAQQMSAVNFKEFFVWLSGSLSAASRSRPGQQITLPPVNPWANVGI
jgi:uncharacterized protein YegL